MSRNRDLAYRAILILLPTTIGLVVACVVLWLRLARTDTPDSILSDEVKQEAVDRLVARGGGAFDLCSDPEVGHVLQPNLKQRIVDGTSITSNALGWREDPVKFERPADAVRVVLLGDSFVMGYGVGAEERLGVFLRQFLEGHATRPHGRIECLHVGVTAWNAIGEAEYLRRQLGLLKPDLVVQFLVFNDLEDNVGVRGFGELSQTDSVNPQRGDGLLELRVPEKTFHTRHDNWLGAGLDWESRTRFDAAARAIAELAAAVAAQGGRFELVDDDANALARSREHLVAALDSKFVDYLPTALFEDRSFRISNGDPHWNRAGHELVATLLYSIIESKGLLPRLGLSRWPAAEELARRWLDAGREEAERAPSAAPPVIRAAIDFEAMDDVSASQVHGGILAHGFSTPYASVIVRNAGARRVVIEGACLDRPELDGAKVEVFVEEASVGRFEIRHGAPIRSAFELPASIRGRDCVTVRLVATDYVYGGADLRLHLTFRARRIALES